MNSFYRHLFNKREVLLILLMGLFISTCYNNGNRDSDREMTTAEHEEMFLKTMQDHLDAVSNRDLTTFKKTLPPDGKMQFILPNREITSTTEDFMRYHREWFRDTTWTLESEILATEVGEKIGIAITEIIYQEPDRGGSPYFNRMTVSYALKNIGGTWYVFKDHASSVETSGKH